MTLEARYRRLLWAYPRSYREQRGDEMVTTLLDGAAPGQTKPTRADVSDLLSGAARERLGLHAVRGLAAGLRLAGAVGLVVATAMAVSVWVEGVRHGAPVVVAAAWVVALVLRVTRPRWGAVAIGLAFLVNLCVSMVALVRPANSGSALAMIEPASAHVAELGFGLLAVLALVVPASARVWERAATVAAVAALGALTAVMPGLTFSRTVSAEPLGEFVYTRVAVVPWSDYVWTVPVALLLVGAVRAARGAGASWRWAGLLLLVPMPAMSNYRLLVLLSLRPPYLGTIMIAPSRMLVGLLGVLVGVAVYLAARPGSTVDPRAPLSAAGDLCLRVAGFAAAVMLAVEIGYGSVVLVDAVALAIVVGAAGLSFVGSSRPNPVVSSAALVALAFAYLGPGNVRPQVLGALAVLLLVSVVVRVGLPAPGGPSARPGASGRFAVVWFLAGATIVVAALVLPTVGPEIIDLLPGSVRVILAGGAAAVLAPTLWWGLAVAARAEDDWLTGVVITALSLTWIALAVGPTDILGLVGSAGLLALLAVVVVRRGRRRAAAGGVAPLG